MLDSPGSGARNKRPTPGLVVLSQPAGRLLPLLCPTLGHFGG